MRSRPTLALAALLVVVPARAALATEICGDGQDNDANGLTDEGCYPFLTTGVCESPLSCDTDGAVSPLTGSLVYQLPPDIAPRVPYGPPLAFRRIYTSMYAPGAGAPAYRKPMGERWQHSYMSWLDKSGTTIVLHTNHGQDILFTKTTGIGGYDVYLPQTGFHFQYLHQSLSSPYTYTLKTLNGDVFAYDGTTGKLTEIWDTLATPNKVLIAYDGNGMVSTVTDAAGTRRLLFGYTSSLLTSVQFQIYVSGTWTTEHTTSYSYTSGALTGVSIGGASAQTNVYTSSYLTQIQDAAGNNIASFAYLSATPGKVVQLSTPSGNVGYDYSSSRAVCSGKTVAYFNKGNTTACKVDSDCGVGNMCGGNTDPSTASGVCYQAARCLTTSTSSETVVTAVSSFGPGGGSCTGACLDAEAYSWNTGTGTLDLGAIQDPAGNYSARAFNSNGLPTTITFGDPDSNPSNGNGTRTVYLFYDSTFPGKLSEVRRKSEFYTDSDCTATVTTGCARTLYTYTSNGLLYTVEEKGFTLNSSGSTVAYDDTTTNAYDSQGRLTETDGPLSGAKTVFDIWTSSDALKNGMVQDTKRYTSSGGAGTYLTTTFSTYDFWGHPTSVQDPDSTLTCFTYDSARGYLTERRETMAGQSTCTSNAADLVTDYVRDSALRLTQVTRPDGGCVFNAYDTSGRLSTVKRRDDCSSSSSGDTLTFTRNSEGLVTKVEAADSSATVTWRQQLTYYQGRQLDTIINPVNSQYTTLIYDARGMPNEIDGPSNTSKSTYGFTADARVNTVNRYKDTSTYDTWNLVDSWEGILAQITDGQSKVITATRDDLGRKVKVVTVDSGTTIDVFDAAGDITTTVEALGSGGQQTQSFTYDIASRPLNSNYVSSCDANPSAHAEIQRTYDTPPTCPITGGCNNTSGRLAYVDDVLLCSSSYTDGQLDQFTYYSYDAAGRVVEEYITDDTGRVADQQFQYDKDGHLSQVTAPSSAVLGWSYGSTGSNSDSDRVTSIWRTSSASPIIDTALWYPFGPFKKYNQENSVSGILGDTSAIRNLAYRMVTIGVEYQTLPGHYWWYAGISEDAKGRTSRRIYSGVTGQTYSYFTYDEQDRVICESTATGACPTSGSTLKNNHSGSPPFTAGGDWKTLLRPIPGSTGVTNTFECNGCASALDTFTDVDQTDGTPTFGKTHYTWDARGNRTSDDNQASSSLTHDDRNYVYDGRRNVITVRGQYPTGGTFHYYDVTSAFDYKNRRVFKSFYDESTSKTAQWFFYYDPFDRLTEVRYTPDTSASSTYSVFQLFWLDDRLVLYWQTDYPSATTSKRYVTTDETSRPLDLMTWPSSGNAAHIWAVNPSAWGFDTQLFGSSVYQAFLFTGQYQDTETAAYQDDGATVHRPGIALNGYRTYDPFSGGYLETDPLAHETWDPYVYAHANPVGGSDRHGLCFVDHYNNDMNMMDRQDGGGCGGTDDGTDPDGSDGPPTTPAEDGAVDGDSGTTGDDTPTLVDLPSPSLPVEGPSGGNDLPDSPPAPDWVFGDGPTGSGGSSKVTHSPPGNPHRGFGAQAGEMGPFVPIDIEVRQACWSFCTTAEQKDPLAIKCKKIVVKYHNDFCLNYVNAKFGGCVMQCNLL